MDDVVIEQLWQEHQNERFPKGYGVAEIEGIDLAVLSGDIAGCVGAFIKLRKLDLLDTAILGLCYRDCAVVARGLSGDVKDYFLRLEKLAKLVLGATRDADSSKLQDA